VLYHQRMDARLRDTWLPAALADGDDDRLRIGERENLGRYKIIRQNNLACGQQGGSPYGKQAGISGSGTNQINMAGLRPGSSDVVIHVRPGQHALRPLESPGGGS
jgi:hypothetical protein